MTTLLEDLSAENHVLILKKNLDWLGLNFAGKKKTRVTQILKICFVHKERASGPCTLEKTGSLKTTNLLLMLHTGILGGLL